MSGYYPDGVTGNEYAIAGADREYTDDREDYCTNEECTAFEQEVTVSVDLSSYGSSEWGTWTCTSCGKEHDYEAEVYYDEVDPDAAYDAMREDALFD